VWGSFFKKLERDRGDTMSIPPATRKFITSSKEVKAVKWNGREIRNGEFGFYNGILLSLLEELSETRRA